MAISSLFGFLNPALLGIVHARLFNLEAFSAPVSKRLQSKIMRDGVFTIFLEDLPQIVVQMLFMKELGWSEVVREKQVLIPLIFSVVSVTNQVALRIRAIANLHASSKKQKQKALSTKKSLEASIELREC